MYIINIMAPIILLIFTGYILSIIRVFPTETAGILANLTFNVSFPALMFIEIIKYGIKQILNINFSVAYILSIFVIFFLVFVILKFFKHLSFKENVIASINASVSNSGLVAFPILLAIVGSSAALLTSAMFLISMGIIIPIFMILLEYNRHEASIKKFNMIISTAKKIILQPFVLAAIFASCIDLFSLRVPAAALTFLNYLGNLAVPCALLALGISLANIESFIFRKEILIIALVNIFVQPFLALFLVNFFHLSFLYAITLIVVSAAPTASTVYVIAIKYKCYVKETSTIIFLTTLFSMFTLPLFLWIASYH